MLGRVRCTEGALILRHEQCSRSQAKLKYAHAFPIVMPEYFIQRIAELETVLKRQGLKPQLEFAYIALDAVAILSYAVVRQSGEPPASSTLSISQVLNGSGSITLDTASKAELEKLVRSHNGIYPVELLAQNPVITAAAAGQAITPKLFINYDNLRFKRQAFAVTIRPDGSFDTDAHVIRDSGKYHTDAFHLLLALAFPPASNIQIVSTQR